MEVRNYLFGGKTRSLVYKSLDAGALRGKAIADNLANVQSPGFKRREVVFEAELRKALQIKLAGASTQAGHLDISPEAALRKTLPLVEESGDKTLPGEVNNVDVDIEASKMAENQIFYNYGIRFAGFDKLQSAITGQPK